MFSNCELKEGNYEILNRSSHVGLVVGTRDRDEQVNGNGKSSVRIETRGCTQRFDGSCGEGLLCSRYSFDSHL